MRDRRENRIRWGNGRIGAAPPAAGSEGGPHDDRDRRDAASVLMSSLSLVLFMASALFVSVGLNPKGDGYGPLAWTYAVVCLAGAVGCWFVSRALTRPRA